MLLLLLLQEWYEAISQVIMLLGSSSTGSIRREYSMNNGTLSAGLTPRGASADPSPFTSPVGSLPVSALFCLHQGAAQVYTGPIG